MGDNADDTTTDTAESNGNAVVIVDEFQTLQQKSEELFEELKYLPQFGQKSWQPYFGKAFTVFTKVSNDVLIDSFINCFTCYCSYGSSNKNTGENINENHLISCCS